MHLAGETSSIYSQERMCLSVEMNSLTLGAHAPEGYVSCPACVSVCVCVCVCPQP